MANFQALRSTSRIFELGRATWIDLPFALEEFPELLQPELLVQRADSGAVETMPGTPYGRWRIRMAAMDAHSRSIWMLVFDRTLVRGEIIEFIRDLQRYFWLSGDTARDVAAGQFPRSGSRYTLVTAPHGGVFAGANFYASGSIAVDRPQQGGAASRCNLIPGGSFLDGIETAGWVIDTPATLSMTAAAYVRPNGQTGAMAQFLQLGTGTKKAHIDFSLDGNNATNLPSEALCLSAKVRADLNPAASFAGLWTFRFLRTSGAALVAGTGVSPNHVWRDYFEAFDFTAVASADTTIRLEAEFSDDLRYAPCYLTELQCERGLYRTAFLDYSTLRTAFTGARSSADYLIYLQGLLYRHQLPTWSNSAGRWGFTVAFWVRPHWSSATIPEATVVFYEDGDIPNGGFPALKIHATTNSLVATARLHDGTTITATAAAFSWTVNGEHHVLATFQDWSSPTASSGSLDLWVDGILQQHTAHSKTGGRQGQFFSLGSTMANANVASVEFRDVAVDPVFTDNSTVLVSDYAIGGATGIRPDRNSIRAVLDPAQRGRSDRVIDNTVPLDVILMEVVT